MELKNAVMRDEISQMVRAAESQPTSVSSGDKPEALDSGGEPADEPVSPALDLPIPE